MSRPINYGPTHQGASPDSVTEFVRRCRSELYQGALSRIPGHRITLGQIALRNPLTHLDESVHKMACSKGK